MPGILLYGLLDIDRNFIMCFGMPEIALKCQLFSPVIHLVICYTMVILLEFGVIGAAFSLFLTNTIIFNIQRYYIGQVPELKVATSVRLFDARNT